MSPDRDRFPSTRLAILGFTPEAIDFKPGTNTLYAIDVGATTTQLYTVNIFTGAATPTSANFPSVGAGHNLTVNQHYGFDFSPRRSMAAATSRFGWSARMEKTFGSIRATGSLTSNDVDLLIQPGSNAPFADASAYINNVPNQATFATTLYDMDIRNNSLYTQNGNGGALTLVGAFGATINDCDCGHRLRYLHCSRRCRPVDRRRLWLRRAQATGTQNGAYLLYQVNLTTGGIINGKLVGPVGSPSDFTGGFRHCTAAGA